MNVVANVKESQRTTDVEMSGVNGFVATAVYLILAVGFLIGFNMLFSHPVQDLSRFGQMSHGSEMSMTAFVFTCAFQIGMLILYFAGLTLIKPSETVVCTLFGKYVGTVYDTGFYWLNPFISSSRVSTKTQNLITEDLKVNDGNGNPIEIGANVVWHVENPAESLFNIEELHSYVEQQCESTLRYVASHFPYEIEHGKTGESLRGNTEHVLEQLRKDVQTRVTTAGVVIDDIRLSHLAYAPEIAHAMLRRQQADAIVSARTTIVEGAVGMVNLALKKMETLGLKKFDDKEQARLITNMMTVLLSEEGAKPVVSLGASE